jgi:hypothetical protein
MTFKDIVAFLLERGNAMQTYWGFYISISLGLIAFFGNAKRSPRVAALLSIAFVTFAYVNCDGVTDVAQQRNVFFKLLHAAAASPNESESHSDASIAQSLEKAATPPTPEEVRSFHIASDVAVLAAIWLLTLWPTKKESIVSPSVRPQ